MRLYAEVQLGDRIDTALLVVRRPARKVFVRLSKHYTLGLRLVPADSDLRRHSWLARWARLQLTLLWLPVNTPIITVDSLDLTPLTTERRILIAHGLQPWRYRLVPVGYLDGWYVRRVPWPKALWRRWKEA